MNSSHMFSSSKKPVFGEETRGAGSVSATKTQKRCPRIRTGPYHTALATRLQTERLSAKKQPQAPAPQKTAALRSIRPATRTAARSERAP